MRKARYRRAHFAYEVTMKRFVYGASVVLLAACHSSGTGEETSGLPPGDLAALRGTWLLVPENSHGDTLVYRRNTYRFRYRPGGRPGFRLGPAGRFTRYDLAPAGGLLAQEGIWSKSGASELRIHLPEVRPAQPDYKLHFVSYQQGVLTLCRRP